MLYLINVITDLYMSTFIQHTEYNRQLFCASYVQFTVIKWHYSVHSFLQYVTERLLSVASLGLVSPGVANKGVTPIFPQKPTTFISHHPLSFVTSAHISTFKTDDLFLLNTAANLAI